MVDEIVLDRLIYLVHLTSTPSAIGLPPKAENSNNKIGNLGVL